MILRALCIVFILFFFANDSFARKKADEQVECPARTPPVVNILPFRSEIIYDFTKSKEYLTELSQGAYSPYEAHANTVTLGLSNPEISISSNTQASAKQIPRKRTHGCVFLHKIDLKINLDPKVYVANDFKKGSCMHKAVLEHEMKHVRVNREVINEYVQKMGAALEKTINARNGQYGPVPIADVPKVQENVVNSFNTIVMQYNEAMLKEAARRQAGVDTIEEYESVGADCPDRHKWQQSHRHKH